MARSSSNNLYDVAKDHLEEAKEQTSLMDEIGDQFTQINRTVKDGNDRIINILQQTLQLSKLVELRQNQRDTGGTDRLISSLDNLSHSLENLHQGLGNLFSRFGSYFTGEHFTQTGGIFKGKELGQKVEITNLGKTNESYTPFITPLLQKLSSTFAPIYSGEKILKVHVANAQEIREGPKKDERSLFGLNLKGFDTLGILAPVMIPLVAALKAVALPIRVFAHARALDQQEAAEMAARNQPGSTAPRTAIAGGKTAVGTKLESSLDLSPLAAEFRSIGEILGEGFGEVNEKLKEIIDILLAPMAHILPDDQEEEVPDYSLSDDAASTGLAPGKKTRQRHGGVGVGPRKQRSPDPDENIPTGTELGTAPPGPPSRIPLPVPGMPTPIKDSVGEEEAEQQPQRKKKRGGFIESAAIIAGLAEAISALGPVFASLGTTLAPLVGQFGSLSSALVPLAAGVYVLNTAVTYLVGGLNLILGMLGSSVSAISDAIAGLAKAPFILAQGMFDVVGRLARGDVFGALGEAVNAVTKTFEQAATSLTGLIPLLGSYLSDIIHGLAGAVTGAVTALTGFAQNMLPFVQQLSPSTVEMFNLSIKNLQATIGVAFEGFIGLMTSTIQRVGGILLPLMEELRPIFDDLGNTLSNAILPVMKVLVAIIGTMIAPMRSAFGGLRVVILEVIRAMVLLAATIARMFGQNDFVERLIRAFQRPEGPGALAAGNASMTNFEAIGRDIAVAAAQASVGAGAAVEPRVEDIMADVLNVLRDIRADGIDDLERRIDQIITRLGDRVAIGIGRVAQEFTNGMVTVADIRNIITAIREFCDWVRRRFGDPPVFNPQQQQQIAQEAGVPFGAVPILLRIGQIFNIGPGG